MTNNYLTLNKGERDSIFEDFGVITSNGVIGIIVNSSKGYSRAISLLNTQIRVNAKLKKSEHFGSLQWDGKDPAIVSLIDVPKQAPVAVGDTIITGGLSTIFPKGIPIGEVVDFNLDVSQNYYRISVALFNDMTRLNHVYIIENLNRDEILNLKGADE